MECMPPMALANPQHGRCPECGLPPDGPGRMVLIDDGTPAEGFPDDPGERCERAGARCGA